MKLAILSPLSVATLAAVGLSIATIGCSEPNSVKDNPYATQDQASPAADASSDPAAEPTEGSAAKP